uniref:Putative F-box protein n=1 Tax=Noccaea caerulescens TaxID=107243 RepID=A0A1J3J6J1_NOCCA
MESLFGSNSVDLRQAQEVLSFSRIRTVKGNTYWYAKPLDIIGAGGEEVPGFLLCFDFTTERFARRLPLPLPVDGFLEDAVVLSSFREEQQLAVLFQSINTLEMEVWVTTKIGPNAVSWSKFNCGASFMVDEEKRAVVVFQQGKAKAASGYCTSPNTAYFIDGDKGYLRGVDLGDREGVCIQQGFTAGLLLKLSVLKVQ